MYSWRTDSGGYRRRGLCSWENIDRNKDRVWIGGVRAAALSVTVPTLPVTLSAPCNEREVISLPSLSLKTVVGPTVDRRAEPVPKIQQDGDPKAEQKYKVYEVYQYHTLE
ncbi:hypothetical protein PENANT_c003G09932 [Penicillium antarcticum]|uniref:Uncharacterized protein n=1 Tax=Penicillium antarcticum TaxID=416450 RepID=A0A1V6QIW9_9EURO|nr:hypothetical protein PENANT_c003G09932 [Penicillium antarcticum]